MTTRIWLLVGAVVLVAVAVIAFVAYGHGGTSGTPGQRLESWVSSTTLGEDIGTLEADDRNVGPAEHRGVTTVHTVCAALANDAQTFNDQLPSPDTRVTQLLAKAYGIEYDAARECYSAGTTDSKLIAQSLGDRARALVLLREVVARVRAVTGASMPTTTTSTALNPTSTSLF